MNFKKISLRKENVIPDIQALVPANGNDLRAAMEQLALGALRQIEELKLRVTSLFDLIPNEYKAHVRSIAETAYAKRGIRAEVMTLEDFIELMAENWLIKRNIFFQIAQQFGFKSVSHFDAECDAAAIVLTRSASFVIISKPDDTYHRDILYGRIQERETTMIPPFQRSRLHGSLIKDGRVLAAKLSSSPIIDILVSPDADLAVIRKASESITISFGSVDHHTLWRVKGDRNGNN